MYKIIQDDLESAADYSRHDKNRCPLVAEMRATLTFWHRNLVFKF